MQCGLPIDWVPSALRPSEEKCSPGALAPPCLPLFARRAKQSRVLGCPIPRRPKRLKARPFAFAPLGRKEGVHGSEGHRSGKHKEDGRLCSRVIPKDPPRGSGFWGHWLGWVVGGILVGVAAFGFGAMIFRKPDSILIKYSQIYEQ